MYSNISNCEIMNNLLKRKRKNEQPALISVTENIDVPKYNVINSPKFTIGRSAEANLQLLITCISRTHCSFLFNDNKNEWSIVSHSKKNIYVGGKPLNTNESLPVKCGDEIRLTSFLTFQFKCSPSPDTQWKCCADMKNAKLSIVEKMKSFDLENIIVIDDDDDSDPNVISDKILLPDSSSADNHDIYENPMPSCSGVIFSPQSKSNLPLTINELKNEIFAYNGSREIKIELLNKIRYIEKLKQNNETCRLYFSDPAENFRLGSLLNELSNFFEDNSKSKICDKNLDVKLFNIIVNLDAVLMEQTKLAMSFMQKFLQPASYGTPERLMMRTREKEDLLTRLDAVTDDKKMAEMKMKLENYDILEYEFKILEEDKRVKDDLQKKVKTLEEQINVLNYDNAQLLNDICSTADQIAKLKEKCDSLEKKVALPVPSTSSAALHHPGPITMPIPMSMSIPMPVNSMPSSTFTPIPTSTNKSHYLPAPLQMPMPIPSAQMAVPPPFQIIKVLLSTPINTEEGQVLRKSVLDIGVMETIFESLAILTHNISNLPCKTTSKPELKSIVNQFKRGFTATPQLTSKRTKKNPGKSQYWAKGTGYGTGDTSTSWDAQESIRKKQLEEENITALLLTIAAYINPDNILSNQFDIVQIGEVNFAVDDMPALPIKFFQLLDSSCLLPVLLSYLRNDSVLDMARHIPLYRAVMVLLRVFAFNPQLVKFFLPPDCCAGSSSSSNSRNSNSLIEALESMKASVDAYASTLLKNKPADFQLAGAAQSNVEGGEEFNSLISDIQATAIFVEMNTQRVTKNDQSDIPQELASSSTEEIYLRLMKKLQFDTYDMIVEDAEKDGFVFSVSYHYEKRLRMDEGKNHPHRMKRLAQEVSSLRTSLPLSFSSTVFVRTDAERLDMMKVLIIGPAETPYMNGCFEFDVYFPPSYPNEPMLINLETTGRHTVRFNPNLYKDGKVCLSILNTWAGRPEEKWNAQTSSFLQVLVSIQSLILVPDPYFNEPGYERMRGTAVGNRSSREYNANIRQTTVKWAMLDQLINPSPCFKTIIKKHFLLKKNEISTQISEWLNENEKSGASSFRTDVNHLKKAIEDLL